MALWLQRVSLAKRRRAWKSQETRERHETVTVAFRAEAFNLFNRANFNLPVANTADPNFGRILSARAPRQVQFGLKVLF
ncbi:MAG: hypothetical protein GEV06_14285 [Luteitalea sp.]|nr:hypothetical protein [Luteitalea sp.]